jgi:hypothetical protein
VSRPRERLAAEELMQGITKSDLNDVAYTVADEYRSGKWGGLEDDGGGPRWRKTWNFLIDQLARRCPGFSDTKYNQALEKGFRDSR